MARVSVDRQTAAGHRSHDLHETELDAAGVLDGGKEEWRLAFATAVLGIVRGVCRGSSSRGVR